MNEVLYAQQLAGAEPGNLGCRPSATLKCALHEAVESPGRVLAGEVQPLDRATDQFVVTPSARRAGAALPATAP